MCTTMTKNYTDTSDHNSEKGTLLTEDLRFLKKTDIIMKKLFSPIPKLHTYLASYGERHF